MHAISLKNDKLVKVVNNFRILIPGNDVRRGSAAVGQLASVVDSVRLDDQHVQREGSTIFPLLEPYK